MQLHPTPAFLRVVTVLTFIAAFSESVIPGATALSYTQSETIQGQQFFTAFDFEAIEDPTHGHVRYVGMEEAKQLKLVEVTPENSFILRAESTQLAPDGRKSVRIKSKRSHTEHVAIYNIFHMPQGCGTWPAVWTVGQFWPKGGEIDIVEGVNLQTQNAATLHTSPGCNMPENRAAGSMLGTPHSFRCGFENGDNSGCGVRFPSPNSYGSGFNQGGGGWYAMERTAVDIKIWFWGRHDPKVPTQVKTAGTEVDPGTWGPPTALFPSTSCDIKQFFGPHSIIINLTFCGDWAGAAFGGTCGGSCVDLVSNKPGDFKDAYFEFGPITLYSPRAG